MASNHLSPVLPSATGVIDNAGDHSLLVSRARHQFSLPEAHQVVIDAQFSPESVDAALTWVHPLLQFPLGALFGLWAGPTGRYGMGYGGHNPRLGLGGTLGVENGALDFPVGDFHGGILSGAQVFNGGMVPPDFSSVDYQVRGTLEAFSVGHQKWRLGIGPFVGGPDLFYGGGVTFTWN